MRLAIADPPYLGRANRWYGSGRGSGNITNSGRPALKPDFHPEAARWDDPKSHVELINTLETDFDGWALAASASTVNVLLDAVGNDVHQAIWVRPNAMPAGARVMNVWEPVLVKIPGSRRNRTTGKRVRDVLIASVKPRGFLGAKPPEWTNWVLDMLGYDCDLDTVVDLFPGSGSVQSEIDRRQA